jgi:hypothetical protein
LVFKKNCGKQRSCASRRVRPMMPTYAVKQPPEKSHNHTR